MRTPSNVAPAVQPLDEIAQALGLIIEAEPSGIVRHQGRTYTVRGVTRRPDAKSFEGSVAILEGARGARYLAQDNGAGYTMTFWNVGGRRNVMGTPFAKYPVYGKERQALLDAANRSDSEGR